MCCLGGEKKTLRQDKKTRRFPDSACPNTRRFCARFSLKLSISRTVARNEPLRVANERAAIVASREWGVYKLASASAHFAITS